MKCENRFCDKEIYLNNCYFYTASDGSLVRWCNEECYKKHIVSGDVGSLEA